MKSVLFTPKIPLPYSKRRKDQSLRVIKWRSCCAHPTNARTCTFHSNVCVHNVRLHERRWWRHALLDTFTCQWMMHGNHQLFDHLSSLCVYTSPAALTNEQILALYIATVGIVYLFAICFVKRSGIWSWERIDINLKWFDLNIDNISISRANNPVESTTGIYKQTEAYWFLLLRDQLP